MSAAIHTDMPFDEYCKLEGINASALKGIGGVSPRHLRAYLNGDLPRIDSPDMRFGRAMHCMILEPDRFQDAFPVAGKCVAELASGANKGQECGCQGVAKVGGGKWLCGRHKGEHPIPDDFVTVEERSRLVRLSKAIKTSPGNQFLARAGYSEAVIQWEQLGFTLKTRIDRLAKTEDGITLIDLKKTQVGKGSFEDCQRTCLNYGYHIATWFHYMAVRAVYGPDIPVESYILFVEDNEPFGTHVLRVSDDDLEIADKLVVSRLSTYKRCEKSGVWFDYQMIINPDKSGILPAYYVKQMRSGDVD